MADEEQGPITITAQADEPAKVVDPAEEAAKEDQESKDTVDEIQKVAEKAEDSQGSQGDADGESAGDSKDDSMESAGDSVQGIDGLIAKSGLTREAIAQEFDTNNGQVSDETVAKLAEPLKSLFGDGAEQVVRDHFAGIMTQRTAAAAELYSDVGGQDGFTKLAEWAKANLPKEEVEAYNRQAQNAYDAGDVQGQKDAIRALKEKRDAAEGTEPRVILGDGGIGNDSPAGRPINSVLELSRIQGTKEYQESEAFREEVGRRVQAAQKRGTWKG